MNRLKPYMPALFLLLLTGTAGWLIYQKLHRQRLPDHLIMGVGRIDGDLISLGVKYPGSVEKLEIGEGDPVRKRQIVAKLGSKELEEKVARLEAQEEAKRRELQARNTDLEIARRTIPLSLERASARLTASKAALAALQKEIAAMEKLVAQDERYLYRTKNLYRKTLIQKELLEKAELKYQTNRERLMAMREREKEGHTTIEAAQADMEEARANQWKILALKAEMGALSKGVEAMRAARLEAEAALDEMNIRSPIDGFVVEKTAEVGEILRSGMPVATLISPHSFYLKIFVDTIENGKIKLGDRAEIFLDAQPDRPIPARVVRIAQKAEFTPKEVSVRSDRIQRVYAVHLKPEKPNPLLKLGLPAVGVISLDGKELPRSLSELPPL